MAEDVAAQRELVLALAMAGVYRHGQSQLPSMGRSTELVLHKRRSGFSIPIVTERADAPRHEPAWIASLKKAFTVVFLRDWHPVLRDPLDVLRLSFPVGAAVFAVLGDWDAVVRLLLPGLAVFAVRAIDVPRAIDWVFCAAMLFQGWGNALHLFERFWWYDNCVHITLPMSLAPILYIGFARLDVVPDTSERLGSRAELWGIALITGCLGVTAASFYEIYEWVVDNWFSQHLFIGETDTVTDLADGFLGAGLGGLFLAAWSLSHYTSRRIPMPLHRHRPSAQVDGV